MNKIRDETLLIYFLSVHICWPVSINTITKIISADTQAVHFIGGRKLFLKE